MAINERSIGSVTIFDLEGRLTYSSGAEMGRRVQLLSPGGLKHVVLNLQHVSYVDSAGLGAMVEAFTEVRHQGGALKLLNPSERTQHLLKITGLARMVATFDSEDAVVASFRETVA